MGAGSEFLRRPYYGDILSGIYDEAYRQGQRIRFFHFLEELHDPLLFNEHVHPEEISALIFFPPYESLANPQNRTLIPRITERISNVICLEAAIADLPSVVFDRVGAIPHCYVAPHRPGTAAASGLSVNPTTALMDTARLSSNMACRTRSIFCNIPASKKIRRKKGMPAPAHYSTCLSVRPRSLPPAMKLRSVCWAQFMIVD